MTVNVCDWDVGPGALMIGACIRLSLEEGEPIPTSEQTAKTKVYGMPYHGNYIDLYGVNSAWAKYTLEQIYTELTATIGANTVSGNPLISNLDTSDLVVGMEVTGAGIPGSTTIISINSASACTLSNDATATDYGVSLTFKVPPDTTMDIFIYRDGVNGNKLQKVTYTDDTTRQEAVSYLDGRRVKTSEPAYLLVGTCRTSSTAGQTQWTEDSKLLCNEFNRQPVKLFSCPGYVDDNAETSYSFTNTSIAPVNGGADSTLEFVLTDISQIVRCRIVCMYTDAGVAGFIALGIDDTAHDRVRTFSAAAPSVNERVIDYPNKFDEPGHHFIEFLCMIASGTGTIYADQPGGSGGSDLDPYSSYIVAVLEM